MTTTRILTYALMCAIPVVAFVLGVYVGLQLERRKHAPHSRVEPTHKEFRMSHLYVAFDAWYHRRAPLIVTLVALSALVGIWIGAAATVTNGRQDRAADATTAAILKCFDEYAQAQSASSSAVRKASVIKDEATAVFNAALNDEGRAFKNVVRKIIGDSVEPGDVALLLDTLEARDDAGRRVERAQTALDRARAENPVPAAPSAFCAVQP